MNEFEKPDYLEDPLEDPPEESEKKRDTPVPFIQDLAFVAVFSLILIGFASTWFLAHLGVVFQDRQLIGLANLLADATVCDWRLFQGDWWRAVSHMFLHGNFGHLFNNLLFMLPLTLLVRQWTRGYWWLAVFFAAGIAGAVLELLVHPNVVLLGASGGIAGLWSVAMICGWRLLKSGRQMGTALIALVVLGVLLYSEVTAAIFAPAAGVAHLAHLGGLLAGGLIGGLLPLRKSDPPRI